MLGTGAFNALAPALTFTGIGPVAANGILAVTIKPNAAKAALMLPLGVMLTARAMSRAQARACCCQARSRSRDA